MDLREIWSGGQTGVDRAAWDAARGAGLAIRGWVPLGRKAEDGAVPNGYDGLQETPTADYPERTSWNVRDTDATLIVVRGPLHGGSAYTLAEAERQRRPVLVVDLATGTTARQAARIRDWLDAVRGTRLNVAGPRASGDPQVYADARALIEAVLALRTLDAGRSVDRIG
jgi:hypothetical protein